MSCHPRYLSLPAVQHQLSLTRNQVTTLINSGALPAFQILAEWRVDQARIDELVDRLYEQTTAARIEPSSPPDAATSIDGLSESPSTSVDLALTPQQQRIGRLVGEGLSNAEIAARLCLEISTVKSHVSRMLQRMNLRDRQQLIAHLWRSGFMLRDDGDARMG